MSIVFLADCPHLFVTIKWSLNCIHGCWWALFIFEQSDIMYALFSRIIDPGCIRNHNFKVSSITGIPVLIKLQKNTLYSLITV